MVDRQSVTDQVLRAADSCQIGQVCGGRAGGGVLERLEGAVLLQALGQVLGGLRVEEVFAETANEKGVGLSMATDSCQIGQVCGRRACGGILERLEGLVLLEALREMLGTLRTELVVEEAANESRVGVLVAADSKIWMGSGVLEGDQ